MVDWLSQKLGTCLVCETQRSLRTQEIHCTSQKMTTNVIYSASQELREMVTHFFVFHETIESPM